MRRIRFLKAHPEHDWASHASDAFRGLAVAYEEIVTKSFKNTVVNNIQDDPYGR